MSPLWGGGEAVGRRDTLIFGVFGGLLLASTLVLVLVQGLLVGAMPRDRTFRYVMYALVAVGAVLLLLRALLG